LGFNFKEGECIVIDIKGEVKLGDDTKKVIVFKSADQVHIYKCDDDFAEGTVVRMDQKSEDSEAEQA
jgi:hypothetical protein